jgi:hypothetical protein
MVFPVWYFGVQEIQGEGEDRIAEEAETDCKSDELDDPVTRSKWYNDRYNCENACKAQSRRNQKEWRRWRKDAATSLAMLEHDSL